MTRSDFWSRRRAAVEKEAQADEAALVAAEAESEEQVLAERTDEELLAELDLPEPEELDSPEAVRRFLDSALPQRLKTRALRRLWRLNPVLANLDGLLDYGEDYTDAANVVENLQTAYQVGKGMLAHVEELARKAEVEAAEAKQDDSDEMLAEADTNAGTQVSSTTESETETDAEATKLATIEIEPAPMPVLSLDEDVPELPATARRMRFHFDHAT